MEGWVSLICEDWDIRCQAPSRTWPWCLSNHAFSKQWASTTHKLCSSHGAWATKKRGKIPLFSISSITRTSQGLRKPVKMKRWMWYRSSKCHYFQIPLWTASRIARSSEMWWAAMGPVSLGAKVLWLLVHREPNGRGSSPHPGLQGLGRSRI